MTPSQHPILIVEDDPQVQYALAQLFAKYGYQVVLANSGVEAIELLDATRPPLAVLVDLVMPGIVGHELLEYMRAEPAFAAVPVAIISGSPQLAPPGYTVFAKPLDPQRLLEFVRAHAPVTDEPRPAT